jgi:hypothetical protein
MGMVFQKITQYMGSPRPFRCFILYLVGTKPVGQNLYPYTRYAPRWDDYAYNLESSISRRHRVVVKRKILLSDSE